MQLSDSNKIWDLNKYNKNTAVHTENETYTYAGLKEISDSIANAIGCRCLVFVFASNTFPSLAAYVGFLNNGIVPVMIDAGTDKVQTEMLIDRYRPMYMWLPEKLKDGYDLKDERVVFRYEDYVLLKCKNGLNHKLYVELALLITTSGSTGTPKLVRQSYKNIVSNTDSIIEYLHIADTDISITTLPMNYVYGLSIINTHLRAGASLVLNEYTLFQKEFWNLLKEKEVTSFGGVPYIYEMLDKLRFMRMDLPQIKTLTQAGGKLPVKLHEKFAKWAQETGKNFVVMYGASEATARMSYLPPEMAVEKSGSIGVAIPGGRFEILDEKDQPITASDVAGELVYYGDNVTLGYSDKPEDLSLGDERKGVLKTGDIAMADKDGYYYVVGRKKRFLKMFGKRINLDEIDALLHEHFGEFEMASSGRDDNLIIFTANSDIKEDIVPFISHKTGINHVGFSVKEVEKIPRNQSGKILFQELEKLI